MDFILLYCKIIYKQRKISLKNIIKEEKIFCRKLNFKPNFNKDEDFYLQQT